MSYGVLKSVATFFTPVLTESQFYEKGVLTPEEFVRAGDFLVYKCRTWEWSGGDPSMAKSYLPDPKKQFLITRRVPSFARADKFAADIDFQGVGGLGGDGCDDGGDDQDEWQMTVRGAAGGAAASGVGAGGAGSSAAGSGPGDIDDMDAEPEEAAPPSRAPAAAAASAPQAMDTDDPDYVDIDGFEDDNLVEDEERDVGSLDHRAKGAPASSAAAAAGANDNLVRTRTYDLSITYDKYYRSPRMFLFGYDEAGQPLTPEQIMEDIRSDHANKTVTVENHPHVAIPHVSIHPCKHASVMKRMMDQMGLNEQVQGGPQGQPPRRKLDVEASLVLFLKFMATVIPTIEYDFTSDVHL